MEKDSNQEKIFNFQVYKTEEFLDDIIEEPVIEVTMENVEEFLYENKWKQRDQAYEFIENLLKDEDTEQQEKGKRLFIDHFDQIIAEKNLAAQKNGLKLIQIFVEKNEIHSNYFLPLMNFLIENVSKKSDFFIKQIMSSLFKQNNDQVIDFLLKQFDNKNQYDIKLCLKYLHFIMKEQQLKSQQTIKQIIFRLKEFLNHADSKIRNLTQKNYQLLFSYLDDDFEDLEKNLFSDLKEMQLKSLKNSMVNIQKQNNSFFLLKNSKSHHYSQGNLHQDNQSMVLNFDQILPEKFPELPYMQNIEEKINNLEELLNNLKENQFSLKSSGLNQVINILINETETSNYLVYSLTIEILQIMLSKKNTHNFTEGQIKQIITQITVKYQTKQNLDKIIIEILTQILQKRYLSQKKLLKFIFNEIDSVSSLNVKNCYLDFIVENYKNFDHSKIQKSSRTKSSRNKSVYKQKTMNVNKQGSCDNTYILKQLKKFQKNEKKIKVKKLFKAAIEKITQQQVINQQVQKSQIKKNKSQNIIRTQQSLNLQDQKQQTEQDKHKLQILQLCSQKQNPEIVKVSLEIFVKLQPSKQQINELLTSILQGMGLYNFLQVYFKANISQANRQVLEKQIQFLIDTNKVKFKNDDLQQVYFYFQNQEKVMLSESLQEVINKVHDKQLNDQKKNVLEKLNKHKKEFQEIFTQQKTPLDDFLSQIKSIANEDMLLQFIKDIQQNHENFIQIQNTLQFNQIQKEIEYIFLNYIAKNEDQVIELSEFFVVMLRLFKENDKKKFFVLILTLCSQLEEMNALFLFPFFNEVNDIFQCFEISFNAVYKDLENQNIINFVHNCFPVFFAKFSQSEINLNNDNFKCVIPAIVFGLEMNELSKTCFDIIQHIQIQNSKKEMIRVFEIKLVQHQKLYHNFLDCIKDIKLDDSVESQIEEDKIEGLIEDNQEHQSINKDIERVSIDKESVQSKEIDQIKPEEGKQSNDKQEEEQIVQKEKNEEENFQQKQIYQQQSSQYLNDFQQQEEQILNSSQIKNLEQLRNRKKLQKLQNYHEDENKQDQNLLDLQRQLSKYKEELQREKNDHKNTITKLINLSKKLDEVKSQLNQNNKPSNVINTQQQQDYIPLKLIDMKMVQQMCQREFPIELYQDYFEEFIKIENYQKENLLFDLKYLLLDSCDFNIFDYILQLNKKNLLKLLIDIISYIIVNDSQENCFVLTQSIIDNIILSLEYQNSIVLLLEIVDENLPDYNQEFSEVKKQFIKYSLKCIEKLINKILSNKQDNENKKMLVQLYKLFSNHRPEDLDENCLNLDSFDEIFRILRYFSDQIIKIDLQGAKKFILLFSDDSSIFVTYVKKYIKALNNQLN